MIRINNIKIRKDINDTELLDLLIEKYKIKKIDIIDWKISKKSIDARKKDDVHYVYSIDLNLKNEEKYKKFDKVKDFKMPIINIKNKDNKKVVIVGCGPSGLFSALVWYYKSIIVNY